VIQAVATSVLMYGILSSRIGYRILFFVLHCWLGVIQV